MLLYETASQECPKKQTSTSLEDLDDAASGLQTPPLHAAVPHDPLAEFKATFKRSRRMTLAAAQEFEIRKMLKLAECSSIFGIETNKSSTNLPATMSSDQLNRKRDLGLAMLVMASNTFNTSTHAFVLAVSIFDRFLTKTVTVDPNAPLATMQHCLDTTTQAVEMPLACFIMACKFIETDAPRLIDVVSAVGNRCAVHQLREAEIQILACLHWDVHSLIGEIPPFFIQKIVLFLCNVSVLPAPMKDASGWSALPNNKFLHGFIADCVFRSSGSN